MKVTEVAMPTLRLGVDVIPTACTRCGGRLLSSTEVSAGSHPGLLSCYSCGSALAYLTPPPRAHPRREGVRIVRDWRLPGCSDLCREDAHAPDAHELERSVNQIEASFYNRMERTGGFGGKGDQLNSYYTFTGDPDWFNEDLARYRAQSPSDIRAAADAFLPAGRRVELTVQPAGKSN